MPKLIVINTIGGLTDNTVGAVVVDDKNTQSIFWFIVKSSNQGIVGRGIMVKKQYFYIKN